MFISGYSLSPDEQEVKGMLCSVAEVKEIIKFPLVMTPLWTTFLVYGLVVSTGKTYFIEQGLIDLTSNHIPEPEVLLFDIQSF